MYDNLTMLVCPISGDEMVILKPVIFKDNIVVLIETIFCPGVTVCYNDVILVTN